MTFTEYFIQLLDYVDSQIIRLQNEGLDYNYIMNMEIIKGRDYLKQKDKAEYDKTMIDKIELYRMHNIEPTDRKQVGTDIYKKFIDQKTKERDAEFIKKFEALHKKSAMIKDDPMIKSQIDYLAGKKKLEEIKKHG